MKNGYRIIGIAACVASIAIAGCRSSRNSRSNARSKSAAPAEAAAPQTGSTSAKQVLTHADSALAHVSQLAAEDREMPPPERRGFTAPPPAEAPYIPKPNNTEYGLYEAALGAYNGQRYDEALALFSRVVETGRPPELVPAAYYWMGESFYAEDRYAESIPYFDYVTRVGPTYKREMSLYKLSRAEMHLGNKQGGNMWYERLRAEYPHSSHIATLRKLGAR